MKSMFVVSAFVSLTSTVATADPILYSAVKDDLTAEATLPNGKVVKRKLSAGADSVSHESFPVPPGVEAVDIQVSDDLGNVVWKGKAGKDDVHVLIPDGKGVKAVYGGIYGGTSATPKAAMLMNITGEAVTVDLVGGNGVGAHRGIKPKAGFDIKDAIKLDPGEAMFEVHVKVGGKDAVKLDNKVYPGRYYLISKKPSGAYRALELGTIPPPKKK